jgi:hypothetical protein
VKYRPWLILLLSCIAFAQSPSPSLPKRDAQQKQPADNNQRSTDKSPIVVKVLPSTRADKEPPANQTKNGDQSTDWWMFSATVVIAIIGAIQTRVFWIQAQRLKETINKMEEISSKQTADIQASLTQTTLAAQAMGGIAESMAINVQSVKESVAINREIADRQKLVTEFGARAYLAVMFDGMMPQDHNSGVRFQPHARITNRGNTPAYDVRFAIQADVVPFPLREDFAFAIPENLTGHSAVINPGLHKIIFNVVPKIYPPIECEQISLGIGQRVIAWGTVKYRDAFDIERGTDFGFTFYRVGNSTQWMAMDTERNNESN